MPLCDNLRELRQRMGESQREVAAAVGVSKYMIIRLENDQSRKVTSAVVARLAEHFSVSVDELLGDLPDDHVPDVNKMLRRVGRLDARDRVLLERIIRTMLEKQALRGD